MFIQMFCLFITALQNTLLALSCDEVFDSFKVQYNKTYSGKVETAAHQIFCENFVRLQTHIRNNCSSCEMTGVMDRDMHQLLKNNNYTADLAKLKSNINCQDMYCGYKLSTLPDIHYESIDFRENLLIGQAKDQGKCGSCWAFGVAAVLENNILLQQPSISNMAWKFSIDNISISEQFILSNSFGGQDYCNGGNFASAIDWITHNFKTIETSYSYPDNFAYYESKFRSKTPLPPKLPASDYYIPFMTNANNAENYKLGAYMIYVSNYQFQADTELQIMNLLSRGIPVAFAIHADDQFSYYNGKTVVQTPCSGQLNHQVVVVGYGMKNGVPVWVVKNSWGINWGSYGFFYLQRGVNAMCSETYAFTTLPKEIDINTPVSRGIQVRGRQNSLDPDTGRSASGTDYNPIYKTAMPINIDRGDLPTASSATITAILVVVVFLTTVVAVTSFIVIKLHRAKKQAINQLDDVDCLVDSK